MEKLDLSTAAVVAYLLMSTIPWLIGLAAGGGLGAVCALGIRAVFAARPGLRRPSVLLPWRTPLLVGLLLLAWSPLLFVLLGLGAFTGGMMVGASVLLLALAFTTGTLVEHWQPSPLAVRLVAGARTLAVASGLVAVGAGVMGGGGLGWFLLEGARLQQYGLILQALFVVLGLALALDLLLGVAQMSAYRWAGE
jgi:hypothetical protein